MAPEIIMLLAIALFIKTDLKMSGFKHFSGIAIAVILLIALLAWGGFFNDLISVAKNVFVK